MMHFTGKIIGVREDVDGQIVCTPRNFYRVALNSRELPGLFTPTTMPLEIATIELRHLTLRFHSGELEMQFFVPVEWGSDDHVVQNKVLEWYLHEDWRSMQSERRRL